ncbi:hypothetical protein SDC9_09219 [bioreactor metagenome]|uniref:Uncharacterized protein n=1 Tax=bioreactor metagenome TaxID=1076179 RepID=A0A644T9H7_9ZZZZ|nr:cell wall-binding repeat-containing protein [Desulfitobacterium hafniense]MEA5024114.1 cell wall-binding repeat-containing protein [Desulfitobacterium hafniense]
MNYRKVKKLLGMLLVVAMLLPMIPVSPVYADTPTDWQVLGNGAFPPQSTSLTSLPVDGGTTYAAVTVGTSKTAVYRLDESGNGQIGSDLEYAWNGSLYADNDTLYFAYLKGDSELKLVKYNLNDMGGAWETLGTPTILTMTNEISLYAHNGILYVVYAQGGQAKLARYDEAGGGFSEIGSFANGYARSLSLKGDGDGNLYVSYIEVGYVNVKKLSSGGSTLEQVGGAVSDFGTDASLFVYGGTPYVAFTNILNSQDQKCVVKKFEGDSWLTVGSGDGVSNDIAAGNSLYIDDEGTPYVAYEGGNGHNATVYRLEDTSWVPVGYQGYASTGSASHLSLAVYDGIAYLAYGDGHNSNAPVVRWYELPAPPPSSVWETVGSGPLSSPYSSFTSLFINGGIPYLAFSDYWNGGDRIVAEKFVGNQWEVMGLNRYSAETVQDGAVYVDENTDTPYLAYITYDADVKVLKLVNSGGVSDWNTVGSTTSLEDSARGLSLYVHNGVSYVAYADMANGDSPVVKIFASGSNVPVPVGDVGETLASYVSMKGDAAGNLYLVFESSPSDRIKVMKKPYASDTWSMVGDFVSPGRTNGPSLYLYDDGSGNVTPYVAYADAQSDYRPIVRKFVGDEWVTVGDDYVSEDFTWETSLYVDRDGTPYVAYVIGEGEYSRVFKLDNNSWVPVGGNGYASDGDSYGISLAVWNGVPYLSYIDHENEGKAVVRRYAPFGIAPTISAQPSHQTVTAGQTATFTVAATGDAPLSYQWKKDGIDITGATSSTLTITDADESDAGSYTCYVSNAAGNVTSNAATLTVNPAPVAPAITGQPNNQIVTAGQTATFTVTATGTAPLSHQWKKDGTDITGATASTLTITDAQASDAGSYTCYVSNAAGNITSNAATLTVNQPGSLVLTAAPGNQHVTLTWNDIPEAAGYSVFKDNALLETVTGSAISVTGLTNGTTYNFEVKALDSNAVVIAASGQVSATPVTTPGIPTGITAVAGNGEATISFTAPSDHGGSPITGYIVTSSPGNIAATGTGTTITVTGLSNGTTYTFTVKAVNAAGNGTDSAASNAVTPQRPRSSDDESSGGNTTSVSSTPSGVTQITVDVKQGNTDSTVAQITVERRTGSDGKKTDTVTYQESKAAETVKKLKEENKDTARIVIPDEKDEVAETKVNIPVQALEVLAQGGINLQIDTEEAKIDISKNTITGISQEVEGDLYFRLVPVKDEAQKKSTIDQALLKAALVSGNADSSLSIVGNPVTIENNMSSTEADITLPLTGMTLPSNPAEKAALLQQLAVYIEHSDGDKELVQGELVEYKEGVYGIRFHINKFSIFTVVRTDAFLASSAAKSLRLFGPNRVETAIAIAQASYPGKVAQAVLATADNYPDALAGSVLAYKLNAPLLLVGKTAKEQEALLAYLKDHVETQGTLTLLGGSGAIPAAVEQTLQANGYSQIIRLGGANRYETALKIAEELKVEQGRPVILAYGGNYPDALSVSSAAAVLQSPILLVEKNGISEGVKDKLTQIKPSKVYIIGLEGVITQQVAEEVAQLTSLKQENIVRIGGTDRYQTSLAVAKYFNLSGKNIGIATGNNFPDALAGSVYAANHNAPMLLLNDTVPGEVMDYLKSRELTGVTLFGGEAVLNAEIEQRLRELIK